MTFQFPDRSYAIKGSAYTATLSDQYIEGNPDGGSFTITLPAASTCKGKEYVITNSGSIGNTLTVAVSGGGTINGSASVTTTVLYGTWILRSNGSEYIITGRSLV